MRVVSHSDYDILIEIHQANKDAKLADLNVHQLDDRSEEESKILDALDATLLDRILPKSLTMWLFANKIKWYSIDSYKFGDLTVTEDSLIDMINNREIVAFAYAIYRTHEDEQGVWSDIKDSIRIIFGVVELVPNSMNAWLRTRYLTINEIESPQVYPDAPPFVLQSMHRPRIWLEVHEDSKCSECGHLLYSLRNMPETHCFNSECEQFKMCTITLECIDFESGPLNDLKKSSKTRSRYCTEDMIDSMNQFNRSVSTLLGKKNKSKVSSGLSGSRIESKSRDTVINCIKCKNCKICQRMLQTKQTRCARHPVCTHFMLKRRLM